MANVDTNDKNGKKLWHSMDEGDRRIPLASPEESSTRQHLDDAYHCPVFSSENTETGPSRCFRGAWLT